MKKIITKFKTLLFMLVMLATASMATAQVPTYKMYVTNEVQTAPNVYTFDVFLLNTSAVTFKLTNVAFGLFINPGIKGTGFIVPSIVVGSSELNSAQTPTAVNFVNTVNYFNLAVRPNPGNDLASTISQVNAGCSHPGTRVATFRVTNQVSAGDATPVPFASNSTSNSIFSTSAAGGRTNTVVTAYDQTTLGPVVITSQVNHLALNGVGTCYQNIALNAAPTCAVTGTAVGTPLSCASSNDGTAVVTLSGTGAGAPGTYTVDGGAPQPYATNPFTVTGLSAGPHTIVATVTAGGCVSSDISVTNTVNSSTLAATFIKTNVSACNATISDGTITVSVTGGSGNYSYAWTGMTGAGNANQVPYNGPNQPNLTGLTYGFYNVTITDLGGCGAVTLGPIQIEGAYTVFVTNNGSVSSSCGNPAGSILLYGNAGIRPYTYSLDGITYQAGNTFTNLAAGTYTGYIKDAAGCVGTKPNIVIGTAAPLVVLPYVRQASSCNADGVIEIYRTGGIGPYTYSLDNITYQSSNIYPGLAAGSYTAYVKDSKNCVSSAAVTVTQGAALTVTANKSNASTCIPDGSIQVNVTGGVYPYQYSIDGGTTYQSSNVFLGLIAGNYVVTVKDFKNCMGTVNVTINTNTIVVSSIVVNATSCALNNGTIYLVRTGGVGPYTYSLDGSTYQTSNTFTGLAAGTYPGYVKDSKGCIGTLAEIVVGPTGCQPPVANNAKGIVTATVAPAVSSLKVQAYPNPSNDEFTLVLSGYNMNDKVSVVISDVMGRKVYQAEGTGKQQYRFGKSFFAGLYTVQVIQGTDKKSLKLVKE